MIITRPGSRDPGRNDLSTPVLWAPFSKTSSSVETVSVPPASSPRDHRLPLRPIAGTGAFLFFAAAVLIVRHYGLLRSRSIPRPNRPDPVPAEPPIKPGAAPTPTQHAGNGAPLIPIIDVDSAAITNERVVYPKPNRYPPLRRSRPLSPTLGKRAAVRQIDKSVESDPTLAAPLPAAGKRKE